jgi:hypothetical protein
MYNAGFLIMMKQFFEGSPKGTAFIAFKPCLYNRIAIPLQLLHPYTIFVVEKLGSLKKR